jgi:hypothetical protein
MLQFKKQKKILVAVFDLTDEDQLLKYEELINTPGVEIIEEDKTFTPKGRYLLVVKYTFNTTPRLRL